MKEENVTLCENVLGVLYGWEALGGNWGPWTQLGDKVVLVSDNTVRQCERKIIVGDLRSQFSKYIGYLSCSCFNEAKQRKAFPCWTMRNRFHIWDHWTVRTWSPTEANNHIISKRGSLPRLSKKEPTQNQQHSDRHNRSNRLNYNHPSFHLNLRDQNRAKKLLFSKKLKISYLSDIKHVCHERLIGTKKTAGASCAK